jgi:rod shape-determining protein MreC
VHGGYKVKIFALLALAFLVALAAANPTGVVNFRIRALDGAVCPLKGLGATLRLARRAVPFASYREKIGRLELELAAEKDEIARLNEYRSENQRLKALLDFRRELPIQTIPAFVIGRDPSNWANSVIIDRGEDRGIQTNRAVLTARGLVGRVVEVGKSSGKVLLITDPNSKVGVIIQRNRQGGLLVGRPDGRCKMIYISPDADVCAGDEVITAGYGSIFPKGIMAGKVVDVGKEPGRLYKYAIVKPAQDLSRIEEVLCIK